MRIRTTGIPGLLLLSCILTAGQKPDNRPTPLVLAPAGSEADSVVDVIVEFREPPAFLAGGLNKPQAGLYATRSAAFLADLSAAGLVEHQVRQTYSRIFFGLSASYRVRDIHAIEQLSYVKRVHRAKVFSASVTRSLPRIRVPEVWNTYGVKGDGIRVGILDSGVDYLHPALGGGFGPGFKVAGGHDFVNNDPDPLDDNGHGTHVAGIVSADAAGLQGVAPMASLYAFKVLDQQGRGREENILAAIEQCADPNQDGDESDRLHVVNMSLGASGGSPDDAISTAVDNATALGITFCVAAGNEGGFTPVQGKEGNYYYTGMETIGSPGLARSAITVGAADSTEQRARFSSQGPSSLTFDIKPDVLAPGVDVLSLAPGGGTIAKSGTSMAAPMVTGIVALLLERTPSLTPADLKALISTSARDLGLRVMAQGAGRVDAMRAFNTATIVRPTTLGFGLDDPAAGTWERAETLSVRNGRTVPQTYTVSLTGFQPGISLAASPPAFTLPAGETGQVVFRITVSNAQVPIVNEDILIFDGLATLTGTADTLRVPWAFVRTSRMQISFSDPDPLLVGMSSTYYFTQRYSHSFSKVRWVDAKHLEVIGAFNGVYDIAAYFPSVSKLVFREQYNFQGSGSVQLNAADAIHELRFDARDETGNPFPSTGDARRSLHVQLPAGSPYYVMLPAGSASLLASTASPRFLFHPVESLVQIRHGGRVVVPQYHAFAGVSASKLLQPGPGAYVRQTMRFRTPPDIKEAKLYTDIIAIQTQSGNEFFNTVQFGLDTLSIVNGETSFTLFLMPPVDSEYSASVSFHLNYNNPASDLLDLSTRYMTAAADSIYAALPSDRSIATHTSPNGGTMTFGGSPVFIMHLSYNNSFGTSVHFNPRFRGGLSEDRYDDVLHGSYEIFGPAGNRLTGGPLSAPRSPFAVPADVYTIRVSSSNHYVRNAKGSVEVHLRADLTRPVPDPPYITSFTLLDSSGEATDAFAQGEHASLRFSSKVYAAPNQLPVSDSTRAWYRMHGTPSWSPLPVSLAGEQLEKSGSLFAADLTSATAVDSTGVDLRIRLVDQNGNATDQVLAPAFAVGGWMGGDPTDVPEDPRTPDAYALHQNYPNPFNPVTVVRYHLPEAGLVKLAVYDLLGREVLRLVDGKQDAGGHSVTINAGGLASGVYIYRLIADRFVRSKKMTLVR